MYKIDIMTGELRQNIDCKRETYNGLGSSETLEPAGRHSDRAYRELKSYL